METPRRVLRNLHLENVQSNCTPLQIPASPFLRTLGFGTGVRVYQFDRSPKLGQNRSPWAVKRVTEQARVNKKDTLFNTRLLQEAQILRELKHPNIVGFRGIAKTPDGNDALALEYCHTSLGEILEARFDQDLGPLPANNCIKMIYDIAKALDYLHTEAKLLHSDIKSFNILVKGKFEICKLCDFGVSLPLDENGEVNFHENPKLEYFGTSIWSAPEVIDEIEVIDSKADIFSFGLVIYETLALVPPHTVNFHGVDEVDPDESECLNEDESAMETSINELLHSKKKKSTEANCINEANASSTEDIENVSNIDEEYVEEAMTSAMGTRPPLPQAFQLKEEYNSVVEMFYCCTNALSEDRPTAKTIWKTIEQSKLTDLTQAVQTDDKTTVK